MVGYLSRSKVQPQKGTFTPPEGMCVCNLKEIGRSAPETKKTNGWRAGQTSEATPMLAPTQIRLF